MQNTSYIALSSQTALWRRLEMVANNMANMNTPGYRSQEPVFTSYLQRSPGDDSAFRERLNFVTDFGRVHDFSPGAVKPTGNAMDLALDGEGFFVVGSTDGPKYTRAGHFMLDKEGQLVTKDGMPLLNENDEPFFIAPNESQFTVAPDGTVATENGPIGKIKVVDFEDPQRLRKVSGSLFAAAEDMQPQPVEQTKVAQGMIEGSNVNGIMEMTRMIEVQRSYMHANNLIEQENDRIRNAMQTWARPA
ncbi:flagellar basal-body rod protein FlgF [Novispirillum sp. DQ9]|uniref:flagellar basal-body rod protein FlgF n=1 Tax=Novispirillum sp. DQ9 TaxID=3398612 RepID=UPI003C7D4216